MNQLQVIEQNGQLLVDSRDVAEMVGKEHNKLMRDIRNYITYISESPKLDSQKFFIPSVYKTEGNNKTYDCFLLTKKGCDMVANKLTGEKGVLFTAEYVTRFEEMEEHLRNPQPKTQLEILQASINQLVEQEKRVNEIEQKTIRIEQENQVLKHRIDNLDQVNIEGDLRQRLNSMIKLYAHSIGGRYSDAWKEFVQAFNTAFRTNLELRRQNHINKTGKDISRPKFLEEIGQLEDAIRVADKLLNKKG